VFIVDGDTAEEIVEKWFDPAFQEFINKELSHSVAVCIRYFYKTGQSSFFYSSEKVNWF
jgi:hypothetical protein